MWVGVDFPEYTLDAGGREESTWREFTATVEARYSVPQDGPPSLAPQDGGKLFMAFVVAGL